MNEITMLIENEYIDSYGDFITSETKIEYPIKIPITFNNEIVEVANVVRATNGIKFIGKLNRRIDELWNGKKTELPTSISTRKD